jgi:hypothetical protein
VRALGIHGRNALHDAAQRTKHDQRIQSAVL